MPDEGQLRIELRGNLAAMPTVAQQTKRSPETGDLFVPVQLVAGAVQQRGAEGAVVAGGKAFKSWPRNPGDTKGLTTPPSALQIALVAGARKKLYRQLCWAAA